MKNAIKQPSDCATIEDIRSEIDRIDKALICLLGERFNYVKEIIKFKTPDKDSISAKDRYNRVITERASWAEEHGLDPEAIKNVYRVLLDYFIEEEMRIINLKK